MLISVLMPVYNAAPFLEECLNSILGQTHKRLEVVVVDDYSTDTSFEILQRFAKQDERVRVFKNKQKGIIPALRVALQESTGTYITRMDADDVMVDHKLASLIVACQASPTSVAVGKVKYFATGKELATGYVKYADWLNTMVDNNSHFDHIYKECVIPSPCWMMSRNLLTTIGGFESEFYPEDYDLAFRIYEQRVNLVGVHEVLHFWRDHDGRASRNDKKYSDQGFLDLKLHYFFKLEYDSGKQLILWGGGRTGKAVAKLLLERNLKFRWFTDNEMKVGHDIYGVILEHVNQLGNCQNAQIITAIKTPDFAKRSAVINKKLRKAKCDLCHFF